MNIGKFPFNTQIIIEPNQLPITQIGSVQLHSLATPKVIILAILCWKPAIINNGIPNKIPNGVPCLYISTAINIIIPQATDLMKKPKETSQVATLTTAASYAAGSEFPIIIPHI